MDRPIQEAVEAVHAKDRRTRRGFVALGILVVLALALSTAVQILAVRAVRVQTDVLQRRQAIERELLAELAMEGEARTDLIRLLRKRFRRADHRNIKGHNLIIEALDRIIEQAGIELEPPLEQVGQTAPRNGPKGGGADGDGDIGGASPPPSPPTTVGQSNQCPPRNPHCGGGKP